MIRWREGKVVRERARWGDAVEVDVQLISVGNHATRDPRRESQAPEPGPIVRALAYRSVTGEPVVGDRVLLNTNALDNELGTGGVAMVVALPDRLPADAGDDAADPAGAGHLVKARYTPLQTMVFGVDEQDSPHHSALDGAADLAGLPVVVADLHSSIPAVLAGLREREPGVVVAYLMTDGGALPAAFSRACASLREDGWLASVISCGQAYGGDLEAVNVFSGLLAARHVVRADAVIVAQGPGNLGTGSTWGFSGVSAGEALNAAAVLGGVGVAALRVSGADPRQRHRGISHHSRTAYARVLNRPADVPVPLLRGHCGIDDALADEVLRQADELVAAGPHLTRHDIDLTGLDRALADSPVRLSTMGRGLRDDPAAFLTAAAAGRHAASLLC
ncbi:DUF3866 family protein [Ornithinimicrobium cryptoxanthini]|uniref:DUF3866 family protein n=1 Tax=Ornithinimicrobium cryptoxanthini TaxID=2934161 RepID=UPI0021173517|nr:DUF3866 family protein [Ornithinimicrobium cryptoxanthini]